MLGAAFVLLLLAVGAGSALALRFAARRTQAHWALGLWHAALGIAGLATLLMTLGGPPRGVAMGVGAFGIVSAVIFAAALVLGFAIPLARRGKAMVIAVHAGTAITGFAIFLAWYALGGP